METINKNSKNFNSPVQGPVKGFKDFTGKEAEKLNFISQIIRRVFEKYNFQEVETPIVEYEKFVRGDNSNDEVISDIFKLKDKGKRELALRYELTFPLKRIAKNKKLPFKRFQMGPVFRDEPTNVNRFRQFTQCDIDTIGSTIKDQAEILAATKEILDALKIPSIIYVNNRKLLNEILEEQKIPENKREEVIREIDKLDKLPIAQVKQNLKKLNADKVVDIFAKPMDYFQRYKFYAEIQELKDYCKYYGFEVKFLPSLARGLSYYVGNVWEIKSKIKETICGGGTYMVDNNISTGISLSLYRLMAVSNILINIDRILVVSLDQDKKAIELAKKLRKQNKNASVFFGKPSKAMEYANSYGIKKVVFVGKKETQQKKFMIKDLKTGKQRALTITKVSKP